MHDPMKAAALLLVTVLSVAACSGPRDTTGEPPPPTVSERDRPTYETFDPAAYDVEPPPPSREVEHDVPEALMAGTVTLPELTGPRTVQGYRIQVFSSADKGAAEEVRDDATGWWRVVRADPGTAETLPHGLHPDVAFNRPYYRVRLGAFEYRSEAEAALPLIRRRFAEAFIVPDRVTVRD